MEVYFSSSLKMPYVTISRLHVSLETRSLLKMLIRCCRNQSIHMIISSIMQYLSRSKRSMKRMNKPY